jgi:hypothetical protein
MLQRSTLLVGTTDDMNLTGQPVAIADSLGSPARNITVGVYPSHLTGTVHIEATLLANPGEGDWFDLVPPFVFTVPPGDYLTGSSYGEAPQAPRIVNTKANVVLVRARLDRSYLPVPPSPNPVPPAAYYGLLDRVVMIA